MFDPGYIKALHIIGVVTWFAGLFYIVRLFVYHAESAEMESPKKEILSEQYKIMERRLWRIITVPAMVVTLGTGIYLGSAYNFWQMEWMWVKLGFVAALLVYHHMCGRIVKQLQNNEVRHSSSRMRIWNEVATLLLVAIVFVVVLKSALNWVYGVLGLVLIMIVLMIAIRWYKRFRDRTGR